MIVLLTIVRPRHHCHRADRDPWRHPPPPRAAPHPRPGDRADPCGQPRRARRRLEHAGGRDRARGARDAAARRVRQRRRRGCPRTAAARLELEAGGARLALVHDAGPAAGRIERLRARFPGTDAGSSSATATSRCLPRPPTAPFRSSTRAARPIAAASRCPRWASPRPTAGAWPSDTSGWADRRLKGRFHGFGAASWNQPSTGGRVRRARSAAAAIDARRLRSTRNAGRGTPLWAISAESHVSMTAWAFQW